MRRRKPKLNKPPKPEPEDDLVNVPVAIDFSSGLTTHLAPTGRPPAIVVFQDPRSQAPWWETVLERTSIGTVIRIMIRSTRRRATIATIRLFEIAPGMEALLAPLLIEKLRTIVKAAMPSAELIAAHALIKRVTTPEAAKDLDETVSNELAAYVEKLAAFTVQRLEPFLEGARQQFVDEADALARLAIDSLPDRRPGIAKRLEAEAKATMRTRMELGPGRPRGTGDFSDSHDFLVQAIRVITMMLEYSPDMPVTEATVAARLETWVAGRNARREGKPVPEPCPDRFWDDRKLRKFLEGAGVTWEDLLRAATGVHNREIMYASWIDRLQLGLDPPDDY